MPELQPEAYTSAIERFCNAVAAEMLLPPDEFVRGWSGDTGIDENLAALARTFRVSAVAVLRRAHDLKLISFETFRRHADLLRKRPLDTGAPKGEGGDFYATFFTRNSRTFTAALLTALAEQRVLHRDAARLLNVRVGILPRVERSLLWSAASLWQRRPRSRTCASTLE